MIRFGIARSLIAISVGAASLLIFQTSDAFGAVVAVMTCLSLTAIVLLVKQDDAGRIFRVLIFMFVGLCLFAGGPPAAGSELAGAIMGGIVAVLLSPPKRPVSGQNSKGESHSEDL